MAMKTETVYFVRCDICGVRPQDELRLTCDTRGLARATAEEAGFRVVHGRDFLGRFWFKTLAKEGRK